MSDRKPGESLSENLERTKAKIADRAAKQQAEDRARRRLARRTGVLPKKPKPQNPLDLVKTAVGMGKKHPLGK